MYCLEPAADTGLILEAGIPPCSCGLWVQWALHIGSAHPWLDVGTEVPCLCILLKGWMESWERRLAWWQQLPLTAGGH